MKKVIAVLMLSFLIIATISPILADSEQGITTTLDPSAQASLPTKVHGRHLAV